MDYFTSRAVALVLYQSTGRTFSHKLGLNNKYWISCLSFCNCEESKYHNCFVPLPNIKSQRKQNEAAPRPAPYDSIQMSRTLNNGRPNDRQRKN